MTTEQMVKVMEQIEGLLDSNKTAKATKNDYLIAMNNSALLGFKTVLKIMGYKVIIDEQRCSVGIVEED